MGPVEGTGLEIKLMFGHQGACPSKDLEEQCGTTSQRRCILPLKVRIPIGGVTPDPVKVAHRRKKCTQTASKLFECLGHFTTVTLSSSKTFLALSSQKRERSPPTLPTAGGQLVPRQKGEGDTVIDNIVKVFIIKWTRNTKYMRSFLLISDQIEAEDFSLEVTRRVIDLP